MSRPSPVEWTGGTSEWIDSQRTEVSINASPQARGRGLGRGTSIGALVTEDNPQSVDWTDSILSSLRSRSRFAERFAPQRSPSRTLLRRRSRASSTRCSRTLGGGKRNGLDPVDNLPAKLASFPCQERKGSCIPGRGLGPPSGSAEAP